MNKNKTGHTPGPIGTNWGNGLPAQRCAKCRTLCAPEIIVKPIGYCEMCMRPVRAASAYLLEALEELYSVQTAETCNDSLAIKARAAIARAEGR